MNISYEYSAFGKNFLYELIPDGSQIKVTEDNKEDYITYMITFKMKTQIDSQIECMREGLESIIQKKYLELLNWKELQMKFIGITKIDGKTEIKCKNY